MAAPAPVVPLRIETPRPSPWRVRPALLVALALSLLLHLAWTFWPVDENEAPEATVLTATLQQMPPPPAPAAVPPPAPVTKKPATKPKPRGVPPRTEPRPVITVPDTAASALPLPGVETASPATDDTASAPAAPAAPAVASAAADSAAAAPAFDNGPPTPELPPRVDLAYKVFFGTRGFLIGDATYRFEHDGDRYRIATVGQARGLAALIVRGTGKVESRGRITAAGLKPYEFAIERGSPDRRELAYFDWDAGNVVLHDGSTAQLEPPAFDPLTILWQPYFAPPGRDDQTFSLATTRKVARYTLSLDGEETIAWPHGEVPTQRWHRRSDDGKTEAWFWLAPSLHFIPIKMRITRTSRGTLEVLLDSIRTDADAAAMAAGEAPVEPPAPRASNPMAPMPGPDSTGQ
jgi:hypothetical protein